MDFSLTDTQRAIQETARRFAQEVLAPRARMRDRQGTFPIEEARGLAQLGLMGVNVPEDLGGVAAGTVAYALALIEVGAADASVGVTMAVTNMCGELIARYGTPEQRQRFVPRLTSGEGVAGSFALSEPQSGSDASALTTFAERRGERYVLNGTKQWITNGKHAGVIVVWARTSRGQGHRGVSAFVVEGGARGLDASRAEEKMGLHGSNTAGLVFEDCEVPRENLLGEEGEGFKLAMVALDGGRVGIASKSVGIARAALEASVKYAHERKTFGVPLAEHQAIRFMLADMKLKLEAARLLTLRAAWLKEKGRPYGREASMAKVTASENAIAICDKAVQIHGGFGYIDEFPVERYFRDVRASAIYEGTSEIQRLVIARSLLGK